MNKKKWKKARIKGILAMWKMWKEAPQTGPTIEEIKRAVKQGKPIE